MMAEKPIGERVAAVETGLNDHVRNCERLQERNFRLLLLIFSGLIALAVKQFGLV